MSNPTEQGRKPGTGNGGVVPPVERRFGQPNGNPRNPGGWKKADTPRYKLEQMMKLSEDELKAILNNKNAPLFERKLASCIARGKWKEIEGMINQVYGQPKVKFDGEISTTQRPYQGLTIEEIRKALNE